MAEFTRDSIKALVHSKIDLYNSKHGLFAPSDKLLIACSGNMDSVFTVHYFLELGYDIGIAHVDHMTRNGQSTIDAKFVEQLANQTNTLFHLKQINIAKIVQDSGNFQETARKERYAFFDSLVVEHDYDKVVIAHHGDDNVETLLMNLGRAGGIKALRGMTPSRDAIIRPFLGLRKEEIEAYVLHNKIEYVQDSSNAESTYTRNYMRNEVITTIEKRQSNWVDQAMKSMEYALEIEHELKNLASELIASRGDLYSIDITALASKQNHHLYLLTAIGRFGFNSDQVKEILASSKVGSKWEAGEYVLFMERNSYDIFKPTAIDLSAEFALGEDIPSFGVIRKGKVNGGESIVLPVAVPMDELIIRRKRDGDYIRLEVGKKKLKKLFSDRKVSNYEKSKMWVLAKGQEVFWILNAETILAHTRQITDKEIYTITHLK